jgi:hypothetical protein
MISNLKNISTCSLAFGCFFLCSCPSIVYATYSRSGQLYDDEQVLSFGLWSNTSFSINSTLNCVIFFWRNSILRREGMKILNAFKNF